MAVVIGGGEGGGTAGCDAIAWRLGAAVHFCSDFVGEQCAPMKVAKHLGVVGTLKDATATPSNFTQLTEFATASMSKLLAKPAIS